MTSSAIGLCESWLFSVLGGDAQLAVLGNTLVCSFPAPQGSSYPLVAFNNLSGKDMTAIGGVRTMATQIYAVHAIVNAHSIAVLDALQARIDYLLQQGKATLAGGYVLTCIRTMQAKLSSVSAGVTYDDIISTYQIQVREGVTP